MYTIQEIGVHVIEHLLIAIGCKQVHICIYMRTWGRGIPYKNVAYCSACLKCVVRNYIYTIIHAGYFKLQQQFSSLKTQKSISIAPRTVKTHGLIYIPLEILI